MTPQRTAPVPTLDDLDLRLLLELDRSPQASLTELAERLEVGERTVGRRYARLREEELVRIIGRTPPGVSGQATSILRVTASPDAARALGRRLIRQPEVQWARLSRDGAELVLGVASAAAGEDSPVLELLHRNPQVRSLRHHDLLAGWGYGGVDVGPRAPGREIDELDRLILTELSRDGRTEIKTIAERAGVNSSTVSRRRNKLIDDGLLHFFAEIAPAALQGTGAALLWLTISPGQIRAAGDLLHQLPECRFVAACSGPASLVAEVLVESPAALVELVDQRLAGLNATQCEIQPLGTVLLGGGTDRG